MNIRYDYANVLRSYHITSNDLTHSILLTNKKGDFYHQGILHPTTKFHGFTLSDPKTLEMFKIIDEFFLDVKGLSFIEQNGYEIRKEYLEQKFSHFSYPVSNVDSKDDLMGEKGELSYSPEGVLQEKIEQSRIMKPKDFMYLGPTGGLMYSIKDYKGKFTLDLDMRKHDDFDTWGREYSTFVENSTLFVQYDKYVGENIDYSLYFAIYIPGDNYELSASWVKKEYPYSQLRGSLSTWYVYRLLETEITTPLTLYMAAGKSLKEVKDQLFLLQHHGDELKKFDGVLQQEVLKDSHFSKPLTQDVSLAYDSSRIALYKLLSKDLEGPLSQGSVAGYPWFHQIWTRDELVSLRGYLELGDIPYVISKIYDYLGEIDESTGSLPRLHQKGTLMSVDGVFWLAKRIEDVIFYLNEKGMLSKYLSLGDLKYIYTKLSKSFSQIIENYWDVEEELLYTKQGDSWMDTLNQDGFFMDVQVQLLGFISTLSVLSGMVGSREDEQHYLDLEHLLKSKIIETYFDQGKLFNNQEKTQHNSNVFLAYYFYPTLFPQQTWELILDRALKEMQMPWGGIASLSKTNPEFQEKYTGEDNLSYHRGDSWYWINNIAAIVLHDANEKKYRREISRILMSSTKDILEMGTFGMASEVSSAKLQESRGCSAQLWSSSTFIEMVHHLFDKEHL